MDIWGSVCMLLVCLGYFGVVGICSLFVAGMFFKCICKNKEGKAVIS